MLTVAIIGAFILMLLAPCVVAFMGRRELSADTPAATHVPEAVVAESAVPVYESVTKPASSAMDMGMLPTPQLSQPKPVQQATPETPASRARTLAAEARASMILAEAKVSQIRAEIAAEQAAAAGRSAREAIAAASAARQTLSDTLGQQSAALEPSISEANPDPHASLIADEAVPDAKGVGRRAA